MDRKLMIRELPTEPPKAVARSIFHDYMDDLGGHVTVYKRVSHPVIPELAPIMSSEDWDAYYGKRRPRWAAECTCSACGETWHTKWVKGQAICVYDGEDGNIYPVFDEESPSPGNLVEVTHNDEILCPVCWTATTLVKASAIREGRTRRRAFVTVDNIGIYTTIFYWLASRHIDSDASVCEEMYPWFAYVIDEAGLMNWFRWSSKSGWKYAAGLEDAAHICYRSPDGMYGNVKGAFVNCLVPSLIGCTGEKTGLGEYLRHGGQWPVPYMKTWLKHPAIENLINAGFSRLLDGLIGKECENYDIPYAILPQINWESFKPHEMLYMDRQSFRTIAKKAEDWSSSEHIAWVEYLDDGGCANAAQFDDFWHRFGSYGVSTVMEMRKQFKSVDFPQIDKYMRKQGLSRTEVRLLADTWRTMRKLYGREHFTNEELWPRNLLETHERVTQLWVAESTKSGRDKYRAGFQRVLDQYGSLQWTDGRFCIILPKDNGELIREGDVLRHCVGMYGPDHVSGEQTIFFVRRYRRPERSYYTLSIDMTGFPKEKQLHGYGNERHGSNKQYTHSIPKEVRDFCDRWKREVLIPWFHQQENDRKDALSA